MLWHKGFAAKVHAMDQMTRFERRAGERWLDEALPRDAEVSFIGQIESPWRLEDCPKNLRQARARGHHPAHLQISAALRPALEGLAVGDAIVLLYWMAQAPRDLLRQTPRHRPEGRGTFALRSPARPNPIGMGVVRIEAIDPAAGRIRVDAIDAIDGTPLVDIKPWLPSVDQPPEHEVPP